MSILTITNTGRKPDLETMRRLFESSVNGTASLKRNFPLEAVLVDGKFDYYKSKDTNVFWCGWALSMRCCCRILPALDDFIELVELAPIQPRELPAPAPISSTNK